MKKTKLLELCLKILEDNKAIDIVLFTPHHNSSIFDYTIVASGNSNRQNRAIAEKILTTVRPYGYQTIGIEGQNEGEWVLIDLTDIVIHIMLAETREYYQLEKLFSVNNKIETIAKI